MTKTDAEFRKQHLHKSWAWGESVWTDLGDRIYVPGGRLFWLRYWFTRTKAKKNTALLLIIGFVSGVVFERLFGRV